VWNPDQYLKFAQPRLRPALDLLGRIPVQAPATVCDLGCGAGNVTRLLSERWPAAAVTGVDDSAAMLAAARESISGVTWVQASLAAWRPDVPVDVLFTNAALHWLPDHDRLVPALADLVAPGGVLAIQMPRNFAAPSHTAILDTIRGGVWRSRLEPMWRQTPVQTPAFYHGLLAGRGRAVDIWETEYLHVLRGEDPVKEWTKGTWLKPFLDRLEGDERQAFERDYARRVAAAYPAQPDGTTLFPFRRLFIVLER
jgi:trans-aconitate 2-methyltransferase